MLTGRESLIRVIGKRRRFLPNRQSLLSTPTKGSVNHFKKQANIVGAALGANGEGSSDHAGSSNGVKMPAPEWVTCPVCGKKVCGENNLINSHLDACLAIGTKRKLSQRTLLQLNFCSSTKVKIHCIDSDCPATDSIQSDVNINDPCGTVHKRNNLDVDVLEEIEASRSKSHLKSEVVKQIQGRGTRENQVANDRINLHSLLSENEKPICEMDESVDDIYGLVLETLIVGRRFGDEVEIIRGASIFLQRDPDNVKDPNAVKVLSADFGSTKMIGFLPRELAQYLSPLMAKFCLTFEGHIASVPKHALAVVPIQIVCQNKKSYGQIECSDDQTFKSLWKCAQHVVKSAKTHPPSMTKYQQNLVVLIQEVLRSGAHLFTRDENNFLETFTTLSDDSQRLFARLYTRKGPWFRTSTFSYPEISDCELAIKGLSAAGYISSIKSMNDLQDDDLKQVLNLLTLDELHEILCTINKKCNRGTRKQDVVALILSVYGGGLCPLVLSLILKKSGACIRLSAMAEFLIWRAERLFFLNGEQDLLAFLIVDLGIVKYPHYNCMMSDQIFPDRVDLLSYEEAIEVAQMMDESLEEDNSDVVLRCIEIAHSRMSCSQMRRTHSESVTSFLSRFSASWVYSKVVLLGVSFLERERRYNGAISLLNNLLDNFSSDGRRGYWILRLSVDLEHIGHLDESLTVAEDGLVDPWVRAGARVALQRRVLRLAKPPRRWKVPSFSKFIKQKITKVHVQGRPLNCETGMKNRFYGEDGEQCGVEELALQYYAGEGGGWQGVHTESGIWLTIYGLLMWDIIFADVPNVFRTRFQTAPLDMETDSFYEVRKNLIEPLLQKILDGMAEEILITSWQSHEGTSCRGVNWVKHSLSELRAAVTCVGTSCLASICRHLAQDYQHWSSGMPDLLLWRFQGDYRGEAKLVEVKGPRDRLSEQQQAWLLFLLDCGFNVEVCKVSPPESA